MAAEAPTRPSPTEPWVVVIAASTGGLAAISTLLASLPPDLPAAVIVVLHRSPTAEGQIERLLTQQVRMPITTAIEGDRIVPGVIYVARPDLHLTVGRRRRFAYHDGHRIRHVLSSANPLFESAAAAFEGHVVAVVLTGYGSNGTDGVQTVKAHNGVVIVQDQATAPQWQMPEAALKTGAVDLVLPLGEIGPAVDFIVRGNSTAGAGR